MIAQSRGTRLRYRFRNLQQARAHVHEIDGRALLFVRDEKLRFLPDAPVCIAFAFEEGEVARLLHGTVAGAVEGAGTWLELEDTRALRELTPTEAVRRSVRLGCDAPLEARSERQISSGRLLDVSSGGARLGGFTGFAAGDRVELRLLSADRLTFHDLSYAHVIWVKDDEMGVRFDSSDAIGRLAVTRLLAETTELWEEAWEGLHPASCCAADGVVEPAPPRLPHRAAAAK
ncbi:MAG: PilZ domain-containing protein [Myxococcales bacterium]